MSDAAKLVLDVLRGTTPPVVRLMREGDVLPSEFDVGFDQLGRIDPAWVWVVERQGKIRGALVASPCHAVALIWRLYVAPGESPSVLNRILRTFIRDIRSRGCRGYMTLIDDNVEAQGRLRHVIERAKGGTIKNVKFTLMAAPVRGGA